MKFSIIVPVYNAAQYLDECIKSVLAQTYTDFELILVDDGSTDSSGTVCDAWGSADLRVRVIHKANSGAAAARNEGVSCAEGEYIIFLDSDDLWLTDEVLNQVAKRLTETDTDVLSLNFCKMFADGKQVAYFSSRERETECEFTLRELLNRGLWVAAPWNKAIRREIFMKNDPWFREGIVSEDIDWCLRLALTAERFDYLNIQMVGYRQRLGSVSGNMTLDKTKQLCKNVQECLRLLEGAEKEKAYIMRPYVAYQYGTLLHNIAALHRSDEKKELISESKKMAVMLNWSDNLKIVLMRNASKVLGFEGMLKLLSIRGMLIDIRSKRSD